MQADAAAGQPPETAKYIARLRELDAGKSEGAAGQIVRREIKRIFASAPRRGRRGAGAKTAGKSRGRQPAPFTVALRERLASDKDKGDVRDAAFYVRWVVDQPGVKLGLKQARPVVYRELRAVRQ